jgi:hypothetical protein
MAQRTATITAVLMAATAAVVAVSVPTPSAAAISCDASTSGGSTWYDGKSASYRYDARFSNSASIPGLPTYTPQGIGTWYNWDGSGKDLLLVTAYQDGANSRIYGINPSTGATVGAVAIAESHVGGIAVSKGWAFVSANGAESVRKYRLSELRSAMKASGTPYLAQVGSAQGVVGASFLANYGDSLWAGTFKSDGRGTMSEYKIADNGTLTRVSSGWEVPTKTQGLTVTSTHFIYSTSYGRTKRSNLYVVRRGQRDLDAARLSCFRAPSMSEGITEYNGTAYLVYESGANPYRSDPTTLNVITKLHKARVSSLTSLA